MRLYLILNFLACFAVGIKMEVEKNNDEEFQCQPCSDVILPQIHTRHTGTSYSPTPQLLYNGHIWTNTPPHDDSFNHVEGRVPPLPPVASVTKYNWMIIYHGKIVALGEDDAPGDLNSFMSTTVFDSLLGVDMVEECERGSWMIDWEVAFERIDLDGKVVLPGLFDSHIHTYSLGLLRRYCRFEECKSIASLQEELVKFREKKPEYCESVMFGAGWDQETLGVFPTCHDIDAVVSDVPAVLFRRCYHVAVANSKCMELCGISKNTPQPSGGRMEVDEGGNPTGIFHEAAMGLLEPVTNEVFEPTTRQEILLDALRVVAHYGTTSVQTNDSKLMGNNPDPFSDYAKISPDLPCRVFLTTGHDEVGSTDPENPRPPVNTMHDSGLLICDRAKLWTDGAVGARTAALLEPYSDDPDNTGIMMTAPEDIDPILHKLQEGNFRLEAHAIGDRAADELLKSFQRVNLNPDSRPVLTHCQVLNADLIKRMHEMGVIANIQPQFVPADAHGTLSRFGPERMKMTYCWKTLRDNGVVLAGGSDAPVEEPRPLHGMYYAITHSSKTGAGHPPLLEEQKMSFAEALEMYTVGGAIACRTENRLGLFAVGYDADLIITDLSENVEEHPDELLTGKVERVIIAGKTTWDAKIGIEDFIPAGDSFAGKNGLSGWLCPICRMARNMGRSRADPDPPFCPPAK